MGTGWYRHLLFIAIGVIALVACLATALAGPDSILTVGLVVTFLGVLSLVWFTTPWLEPEWPLNGKDGWLTSGAVLVTVGILASAVGLLLRLLL